MDILSTDVVISVSADELEAPDRIDRWLVKQIEPEPGSAPLSRSRLKALILEGRVRVGEATITDPSAPVKPGETYEITLPEPISAIPKAQDIALDIIYEDTDLIVINKPVGMVVHPAPGNLENTLVNALLGHCGDELSGIGGVRRPGIVHRIDKDTSGLLVVAKSDLAHQGLVAQFQAHDMDRIYAALVWDVPLPAAGKVEGAIARSSRDRKMMSVVRKGGKDAITHYKVRARFSEIASLLDCRLETGRTHQIRVHMTHLGHPLVGDPVYGRGRPGGAGRTGKRRRAGTKAGPNDAEIRDLLQNFPRQALHARTLGFVHPVSGETLSFESPLPPDLSELMAKLDAL
jgi:23S rRNA pseudouridine1911/1915/1917 synthase